LSLTNKYLSVNGRIFNKLCIKSPDKIDTNSTKIALIQITQFVYVREGMEDTFHEFESHVLPLLEHYGGKLLMRIRPIADSFIAGELDSPYEIHLVSFEDEDGLQAYNHSEERKKWLALKEASVTKVIMVKG
jgi:uncharacterized protein (DUF1330 family)